MYRDTRVSDSYIKIYMYISVYILPALLLMGMVCIYAWGCGIDRCQSGFPGGREISLNVAFNRLVSLM